jgi:HSP20 family protein
MYLTTFDPFAARLARRTAFGPVAMPLDVVRHDGDVTLRFDVPGSDPDSIEVTVDRGVLTVSVKRHEERTENDKFFVRERSFGTFTRRLRLSENLNADAIEASYTNGVLQVRIPVLEQAKPRKVEVRQGEQAEQIEPAEQAEQQSEIAA